MADLLPSSSDVEPTQGGTPRVLGVDSDDAGDLLGALSSDTARDLLSALHAEPATASELGDRAGTSLQNAQYHLGKLEDADLVEVVDTIYSEKGREMKVYAPTDQPLVLFAGREEETSGLQDALSRLLGVAVLLGAMSAAVQYAFQEHLFGLGQKAAEKSAESGGQIGAMDTASQEGAKQTAESAATAIPPGLLFFAGGAVVLAVGATWWYLRNR